MKRWMRRAYDLVQHDRLFDLAVRSASFASLARRVFFHAR